MEGPSRQRHLPFTWNHIRERGLPQLSLWNHNWRGGHRSGRFGSRNLVREELARGSYHNLYDTSLTTIHKSNTSTLKHSTCSTESLQQSPAFLLSTSTQSLHNLFKMQLTNIHHSKVVLPGLILFGICPLHKTKCKQEVCGTQ